MEQRLAAATRPADVRELDVALNARTNPSTGTIFIILPQLPSPEVASQLRSEHRFESAGVFLSGVRNPCSIKSISPLGATLRGGVAAATGAEVAVELSTGLRPSATVVSIDDEGLTVEFKQPVDVLALINRNLLAQPTERRRMPRVELRCSAWLKRQDEISAVTIRNLSAGGLQLEAGQLPSIGAEVSLYLEGLNVPPADVVWKQGVLCGAEFRHELGWALILPWLRTLVRGARR